MKRMRIGIAVDRYRADPEALRSAHDAARNLAAIRDEDFAEHPLGRCPSNVDP